MPVSTRKGKTPKALRFTKKPPEEIPRTQSDQDAEEQILFEAAAGAADSGERASHDPAPSTANSKPPEDLQNQSPYVSDVAPPPTPYPSRYTRSRLEDDSSPAQSPDNASEESLSSSDMRLTEEDVALFREWDQRLMSGIVKLCNGRPLPPGLRMKNDHDADDGGFWSNDSSIFPILPEKKGPSVLEMPDEATQNLFHNVGDLIPPEFRHVLPKDGINGFKRRLHFNTSEHKQPNPANLQDMSAKAAQGSPIDEPRPYSSSQQQHKMANGKIDLGLDLAQFEVTRANADPDAYFQYKFGQLKQQMTVWVEEYFSYSDNISPEEQRGNQNGSNQLGQDHLTAEEQQGAQNGASQLRRDQVSEALIYLMGKIAGKKTDWYALLEHGPTRTYVVFALLAVVLEGYVFEPILFGSTPEQEDALLRLGEQMKDIPNTALQGWLSLTIQTMFPSSSSIPHFTPLIDRLTTFFKRMTTPLLNPLSSATTQPHFTSALHKIFHTAAQLSYEIRCEPTNTYRLVRTRPGTPYDSKEMVSPYETPVHAGGYRRPLLVRFPVFPALLAQSDPSSVGSTSTRYRVVLKPEVVVFRGVLNVMGVYDEDEDGDGIQGEEEQVQQWRERTDDIEEVNTDEDGVDGRKKKQHHHQQEEEQQTNSEAAVNNNSGNPEICNVM